MTITEVVNYIIGCDPAELSTINDALSDRLDELFASQVEGQVTPEEEVEAEETALPPESF